MRDAGLVVLLLAAAFATHVFFHGAVDDNSRQCWDWADNVFGRKPLAGTNAFEDIPPLPALILHGSFTLLGHTLVALHLPSFLAAMANPVLAYLLLLDLFRSRRAALAGGLLLLAWPTGLFFLNQALSEPINVTFVLAILLTYERRRLVPFLVLSALSLPQTYDAAMIHIGIALDCLLNWRRSPFHRRLGWIIVVSGAALTAGVLLDALVLHWNVFPVFRLKWNLVERFGLIDDEFSPAKIHEIARLYFAYLLVPVVAVGIAADLRRDRRLWASVPLLGYLFYEIVLRPYESAGIPVTLRHLTLVIPCGVVVTVSAVRAVAERGRTWGRWPRRLAAAYGLATLAAILLMQARYWYYRTSVEVSVDPIRLVRSDHELPRYVYVSSRDNGEPEIRGDFPHLPAGGPWQDVVLDLESPLVALDEQMKVPHSKVERVDVIGLRGRVELEGVWVVDSASGRSEPIPLEDWRPVSPEGEIRIHRPSGEPSRLELAAADYRFGIAYPLDRPFAGGGRGDQLRLRVRGKGGQAIVSVAVWNQAGVRSFLTYRSQLGPLLESIDGVDEQVIRTYNDEIYRKCLGFFRPEGLWMMAPILEYDWAYYEIGGVAREIPSGRLARTTEGEFRRVEHTVGLAAPGRGTIEYHVRFDRPIEHLSLAAFFAHLAPTDAIEVHLQAEDGSWRELGRVQGALRRTYWGHEEAMEGRTEFRLRMEVEAGWLPGPVRTRFPAGVRDLAIGVRLAE